MRRFPFVFLFLLASVAIAYGQSAKKKTLFILDSIVVANDPEYWNHLHTGDIADITSIKDKDALKRMGRSDYDEVIQIFTKAYRNRPDSVKRIPSLKQMERIDNVWNLDRVPYTGRYIDYYNSGRIQNEGYLKSGKPDGQLTIYYQNGMKLYTTSFKNGILHGVWNVYYKNGGLRETREYFYGDAVRCTKTYFFNGQVESELLCGKKMAMDTSIRYFSSGKVREIVLISSDRVISSKKPTKLGYYNSMFSQSLKKGDLKKANKYFREIELMDGGSIETKLKEGLLRLKESRFDEAIALFDETLKIEPYTTAALLHRGLARIKKYRAIQENSLAGRGSDIPITIEDMEKIPADELRKVCSDLLKADEMSVSDEFVRKYVSEAVLEFCRK